MLERGLARSRGTVCGPETAHTQLAHIISAGPALEAAQSSWKDVWSPPPPSHSVTYTSERKEVTGASDGMEIRWSSGSDDTDMAGSSSPNHAELTVIQPGQQAEIL